MRPEQIAEIRKPSDPNLHPDGTRVAYVVQQADLDEDRYLQAIWLWDGQRVTQFTRGSADKAPRWSPDGSRLAFLRALEPEGHFHVVVMPTDGGEPAVVTDFALGAKELAWSPDGRYLAVVARTWLGELQDLEDDERDRLARRITRLPYRADNDGWIHDRRDHIWLVDSQGVEEPRCLTPGDFNETGVVWNPAGDQVAFLSSRHAGYGLEAGNQVFTVDISGKPQSRSEVGMWDKVSFDQAENLYAAGISDQWGYPDTMHLYRFDDARAVAITADFDRNMAVPAPPTAPGAPQWLEDGSARVLVEDAGTVGVSVVSPAGEVAELIGGRQVITGASFSGDGSKAAYVASTTTNPGELWIWDGGEATKVTDLNGHLEASMAAPSRFTIAHEGVEIEGWVYMPPGDGKVPTLLNIHGGPATQYGWGFFDEFQVYVGAGYGVVAINPRGSSGYGRDHVQASVGQWQSDSPSDLRDLLAAVDAAASAEPRLDAENVGVMGGSYGGLATVRIIAADQRYKSAVAERGVYVFNSFAGTSDIGPWFTRMYVAPDALDSQEAMWSASSIRGFAAIETPTLIIHSENDLRCPIEQAEQLFAAMLRNGTPVELLRFPGASSHELSRSGKPRHRVDRFEAIIEWHGRYL